MALSPCDLQHKGTWKLLHSNLTEWQGDKENKENWCFIWISAVRFGSTKKWNRAKQYNWKDDSDCRAEYSDNTFLFDTVLSSCSVLSSAKPSLALRSQSWSLHLTWDCPEAAHLKRGCLLVREPWAEHLQNKCRNWRSTLSVTRVELLTDRNTGEGLQGLTWDRLIHEVRLTFEIVNKTKISREL